MAWIAGSLTLVILAICAVLYAHARNCGPLSSRNVIASLPPFALLAVSKLQKPQTTSMAMAAAAMIAVVAQPRMSVSGATVNRPI